MTLIFCLKHTLTLEDDVDVWLAKLVQGGMYSTRPPIFLSQKPNFIADFCVS